MIYAMSDFHLPSTLNKDMEMFGWGNHLEKIKENWNLTDDDYIIMPGDLSWALKGDELIPDLEFLHSLKGKKILLRGNHDLWWNTANKVKNILLPYDDISFINNNSISIDDISICGIRGWDIKAKTDDDIKKIDREIIRLKLSLDNAECDEKIVFFHYPPIYKDYDFDLFLNVLREYNIKEVYYGHLHGKAINDAIEGEFDGIKFRCVAADQLDFKPLIIK